VREIQFRRQETKRKPGKKNQKPGIFASMYRIIQDRDENRVKKDTVKYFIITAKPGVVLFFSCY